MSLFKLRHPESGLTIDYDPQAKAVYINIKDGKIAKTIEKSDQFFLDLDKDGGLLGIEILNPSKNTSQQRAKLLTGIAKHFKVANLQNIHPEYVPQVFAA